MEDAATILIHFSQGEAAAADPENREAVLGGRAVTNLRSRWLHLRCDICGHSFRNGDAVEVGLDGKVSHASKELPCNGGDFAMTPDVVEAGEFFEGLDEAWPPPAGLCVKRLEQGSPQGDVLLAPPVAGFRRHRCAVCGHTFRPLDQVVICPCRPHDPMCILAIHRDPVRGLNCWEAWNPGQVQRYCPVTSRKLHA